MKTPIFDDDFTGLRDNCDPKKCPSMDDFERYAKGFLASIDEDIFNEIEDCLFLRKCPFALLLVGERDGNSPADVN